MTIATPNSGPGGSFNKTGANDADTRAKTKVSEKVLAEAKKEKKRRKKRTNKKKKNNNNQKHIQD